LCLLLIAALLWSGWEGAKADLPIRLSWLPPNNRLQRTALRAAA